MVAEEFFLRKGCFSSLFKETRKMEYYIEHALVYNALQYGLITVEEVLTYLLDHPVTTSTLIAYRHVLLASPKAEQYCGDTHFLCRASPEYGAIYANSAMPDRIKTTREGEEVSIAPFCFPGLLLITSKPDLGHACAIICDNTNTPCNSNEDVKIMYGARSQRLLQTLGGFIFPSALAVDWIEPMRDSYKSTLFPFLVGHCLNLKKEVPVYWKALQKPYREFIEEIWRNYGLIPHPEYPEMLQELFGEDFFTPETFSFTPLVWYLYQLPLRLQGYFLGYPIHIKIPTPSDLLPSLKSLSEKGVDKYIQEFTEKHSAIINETTAPVNDNDTLEESPASYSPIDVVVIEDGVSKKKYAFTRPEFDNLSKTGKNHWTNLAITTDQSFYICTRDVFAQALSLPEAVPLKDHLENIFNYKLSIQGDNIIGFHQKKEEESPLERFLIALGFAT
jgi:hypothetical protein